MELKCFSFLNIGEHARLQLRDQRRVTGQDAEFAAESGTVTISTGFTKYATFWCNDFELDLFSHVELFQLPP